MGEIVIKDILIWNAIAAVCVSLVCAIYTSFRLSPLNNPSPWSCLFLLLFDRGENLIYYRFPLIDVVFVHSPSLFLRSFPVYTCIPDETSEGMAPIQLVNL